MPIQTKQLRKDGDFNSYANNVLVYLNNNKARLLITPVSQSDLVQVNSLITTAGTGWNSIYPQSQNPAVCTTTITSLKNTLRSQIETLFRAIFADIPKSILTQVDRDTLNLPLPSDTRTAATKPTQIPSISVNGRGYLSVVINVVDTDFPQSLSKPVGIDSIEIQTAFLPVSISPVANFPSEADFRHLAITGKCSYSCTYTSDQLQGTSFIRARYLNTRKESGNWSQPISIIVS